MDIHAQYGNASPWPEGTAQALTKEAESGGFTRPVAVPLPFRHTTFTFKPVKEIIQEEVKSACQEILRPLAQQFGANPATATKPKRVRNQAQNRIKSATEKAINRLDAGKCTWADVSRTPLARFLISKLADAEPEILDIEERSFANTYLNRGRGGVEPPGLATGKKGAEFNQRAEKELARAWGAGKDLESEAQKATPAQVHKIA